MPKKKNKRKGKKAKKKVALQPKNSPSAQAPSDTPPVKGIRGALFKKLYANDCEGLYRLVIIAPLFVGSWVAGGLIIEQMLPFVALTAALMLSQYSPEIAKNKRMLFAREFRLISAGAVVGVLIWYYSLTKNAVATILFGLAVLIEHLVSGLDFSSVRHVFFHAIGLVVRLSIYSLVAVTTQTLFRNPNLEWQYAVFGFVPAMILASSLFCKHSQVFIDNGWKRFVEKTKKDGTLVKRPSGLTRAYSMFLVLGPAIPAISVPFDVFPTPFLACALAFYPIPKLLEKFLNQTEDDQLIAFKTANLALGMTGLMLVIGILVRIGVV